MSKPDLTSWVAYGSSGSLTVFGFALSDIAAVVGILLGVGTFFVNLHYRRKEREDRLKYFEIKANGERHVD